MPLCGDWGLLLVLIGTWCLLRAVWFVLNTIWWYVIRPRTNVWRKYGRPGSYAIVTGATDGIGLAYVHELAAYGFNILMVSRDKAKLNQRKEEVLAELHKKKLAQVEISVVQLDFNVDHNYDLYRDLEEALKGKDIAILVNNVGVGTAYAFEKYPISRMLEIIRVNLYSFAFMTRLVLPLMLTRSQHCAVISMSSAISRKPWPYALLYGSTKSFMNSLMASLSAEYAESNVDFMNCITGAVLTNMNSKLAIGMVQPAVCAQGQLQFLGTQTETYGPLIHHILPRMDIERSRIVLGKMMYESYIKKWAAEVPA